MIRLLILAFALLAGPTWAQQDGDAAQAVETAPPALPSAQQPVQPSSQQQTTESEAAKPLGNGAFSDAEGSLNSAEGSPIDAQGSPLDYRPSEQISEDLSVSFPVDI